MPVVYNRLPAIAAAYGAKVETALMKTAFDTQRAAMQAAPVDTGNLVASITAKSTGALRWQVSANTPYAIYVEMGTRHMSAQPYLLPALRQTWPQFMTAIGGLS